MSATIEPTKNPIQEDLTNFESIDQLVSETLEVANQISHIREQDPTFLLESANLLEQNKYFDLAKNIYQTLIQKKIFIDECLEAMARIDEEVKKQS